MCGIAGIVGRISEPNRNALDRMADAMARRGPDGAGVWVSPSDAEGNGCLLAHRRLSILDLSNSASQPMSDDRFGKTLVFNGEIYNYQDLRSQLQKEGESFTSSGDTEVLLRWLATRGLPEIDKLRGMFAFAMWDEVLRQLTIARDPLGIKPLYICRNPDPDGGEWTFVFASEVRAILASGLLHSPKLNPAAVESIAWNGFVLGEQTMVQGVESVKAGELRIIDVIGKQKEAKTYWSLDRFANRGTTEDDVAAALEESVRTHMMSDVPVGVFLSGGIDSSAVANLAKRTCGDVRTFTLVFEESQFSEAQSARDVAKAIGTEHQEVMMTEARFLAQLDDSLASLDQPSFDGINSYCIARAVREAGMKVALAGCGGDELFGGYESFRQLPRMQYLSRQTSWVPRGMKVGAARAMAAVGASKGSQNRWAKLPDMVHEGEDMVGLYQMAYALFLPSFQEELLARRGSEHGMSAATYTELKSESAPFGRLGAVSALETRCFLGQRLLRDADGTSMAVSLELRTPITDSGVAEAAFGMKDPERFLPLGRKEILRRIGLRGLDRNMFDRPKSGFVMPFERWLRSALCDRVNSLLCDEQAVRRAGLNPSMVKKFWERYCSGVGGLYWSRVWALYVLVWWCNHYGVTA
jgi:asparagine synthase (glutamine-hydrolysing)